MVDVTAATVTLARVADAADAVTVDRLSTFDHRYEHDGTFVQFEGRAWPTGIRSTGKRRIRPVVAIFGRDEQTDAANLVDFLERAAVAADARIDVASDVAIEPDLDVTFRAEVHHWQLTHRPAGVVEVSFDLTRVG